MNNGINADDLRVPTSDFLGTGLQTSALQPLYKPGKGEKFLKGPIPWSWLQGAASSSGKALHVAVALWFFVGMSRRLTVAVNLSRLGDLGVSRDSARRGLHALEKRGLVFVQRHPGRKPLVTVLLAPTKSLGASEAVSKGVDK